jgi:WD40 repeat protein
MPVGGGVVIDDRRVLTCAHVVPDDDVAWVAFPKAGDPMDRRRVVSVAKLETSQIADAAVLELEAVVPANVTAAPLRCPRPADLEEATWWAYGFPRADPLGNAAHGSVGASLGYGWVRLDAESRYLVEPGFSGGGLWSADYRAVIGLVGQANDRGDGRALTLYQADLFLPDHGLGALARWSADAAGELALAAWGWELGTDIEARRHWHPRGRGVGIDSERGYRFRGRAAALGEIVAWLDRDVPDRRVLVVTGSPGAGKSAVLGRVVTTADTGFAAALPDADDVIRARPGSVACAVHAKGKTALEVAAEIARAASAALPQAITDLGPAIRDALTARDGPRFNVIIDALDEATDPEETRMIVADVAVLLAETCADVGVQVVAGTRRRGDGGDLLAVFGPAAAVIDLDDQRYFSEQDLADYALATLQLTGDERADNPYADHAVADPVACRIAELADGNFLIAGLVARMHGLHDQHPVTAAELRFTPTVDAVLRTYLLRLAPVAGLPAAAVLTPLAFAEPPGMPTEVWQATIEALEEIRPTAAALARFARSAAGGFLVETGTGAPVFRLFHHALSEALLSARADLTAPEHDHRLIARALLAMGESTGWSGAPEYLLRSLPSHAAHAGNVDDLLTDDDYLLHADLRRLLRQADRATSATGRARAQLARFTPAAFDADPATRAAMFSVTEVMEDLGSSYSVGPQPGPYRARWAQQIASRAEQITFFAHAGWVRDVCLLSRGEETLIVTAGDDGAIGIWDPVTGEPRHVIAAHEPVQDPADGLMHQGAYTVCTFVIDGRTYLASGGHDACLQFWDPETGENCGTFSGHVGPVRAICAFDSGGDTYLASAGHDATVRAWRMTGDHSIQSHDGHAGQVNALCVFIAGEDVFLASAGDDATVCIWDIAGGQVHSVQPGHQGPIHALCAFTAGDDLYLASSGEDATVRILRVTADDEPPAVLAGFNGPVRAMCAFSDHGQAYLAMVTTGITVWQHGTESDHSVGFPAWVATMQPLPMAGRSMLIVGGGDGSIRIWDPIAGGRQPSNPQPGNGVRGAAIFTLDGRVLAVTTQEQGAVRIWDTATGELVHDLAGHTGPANDVCALTVGTQALLATSGYDDTVRIWDPSTGRLTRTVTVPEGVWGICAIALGMDQLLAAACGDGSIRLLDPATGTVRQAGVVHTDAVYRPKAVEAGHRTLIATTDDDNNAILWDPAAGTITTRFRTEHPNVVATCPFTLDGTTFLATGGWDTVVRIWDPATGRLQGTLHGHTGRIHALCVITNGARTYLATASDDRTARIWDTRSRSCLLAIPVHRLAQAIAASGTTLLIGFSEGMLCLDLNLEQVAGATPDLFA